MYTFETCLGGKWTRSKQTWDDLSVMLCVIDDWIMVNMTNNQDEIAVRVRRVT